MRKEDLLNNSKKEGNFHLLCSVQVTRIYIAAEEKVLGFVLVSKRAPSYTEAEVL